jgi:hypothetical protein
VCAKASADNVVSYGCKICGMVSPEHQSCTTRALLTLTGVLTMRSRCSPDSHRSTPHALPMLTRHSPEHYPYITRTLQMRSWRSPEHHPHTPHALLTLTGALLMRSQALPSGNPGHDIILRSNYTSSSHEASSHSRSSLGLFNRTGFPPSRE